MIDALILMDKTALDIAWIEAHPPDHIPTDIPDNVQLLNQARRVYWKDSGANELFNVLATQEELDQFMVDHPSVIARYDWIQGTGMDALDTGYQTIPAEILALMKDHVTYDIDGNPTGSTPATYENPNWGHRFAGQKQRIFAGGFNSGFSRGFK